MEPDFSLFILFLFGAFFFGSIPSGMVIARIYGVDIRGVGSGNIGATNVLRCIGKKAGYLTFAFDMCKGLVPLLIASLVFSRSSEVSQWLPYIGLASILGHCFSPFLKGRGGKGVATGFAVFFFIFPLGSLIAISIFIMVFYFSRYVSLSSIIAAFVFILTVFIFSQNTHLQIAGTLAAFLIVYRHRLNMIRLWNGEESRFSSEKFSSETKVS
jgi:acyl phosphate:glycerol-3-phosphate acyltransferase